MATSRTCHCLRKGYRPLVLLAGACPWAPPAVRAQGFEDLYLGTSAGNPSSSTGNRNTAIGKRPCLQHLRIGQHRGRRRGLLLQHHRQLQHRDRLVRPGDQHDGAGQHGDRLGRPALQHDRQTPTRRFGVNAMDFNTTGASNTAIGFQALFGNSTGSYNTALGANALNNATGSSNIALGRLGRHRHHERQQQHRHRQQRSGQRVGHHPHRQHPDPGVPGGRQRRHRLERRRGVHRQQRPARHRDLLASASRRSRGHGRGTGDLMKLRPSPSTTRPRMTTVAVSSSTA